MINLLFYIAPRTAWGTILFGIIGSLQLLRISRLKAGRRANIAISAFAALCIIVNLAAAIFEQSRLTIEFNAVRQLYTTSDDGVIYYDNIKPRPTLSLFKTSVRCFNQRHPLTSFALGYEPHQPLTILPSALRDFDAAVAQPAASWPQARLYKGYVVIDADEEPDGQFVTITDRNGDRIESRYRLLPFTDSAGAKRQLLLPHVQLMSDGIIEVMDINDPDPRP